MTDEQFCDSVDASGDCWIWTRSDNGHGYGVMEFKDGDRMAHRMAWEILVGPIPEGLDVLHHCDTPACVRPEHLFLGTDKDNVADCIAKGRRAPPPTQKLAQEDVDAIRVEYVGRYGQRIELAVRFGVSPETIGSIVAGRTWSNPNASVRIAP